MIDSKQVYESSVALTSLDGVRKSIEGSLVYQGKYRASFRYDNFTPEVKRSIVIEPADCECADELRKYAELRLDRRINGGLW